MSKFSFAARFGLVSLLLAATAAYAQDDGPGYPAAPVATEAPALIAQAQVTPKATPAAPAAPAKRVHDPLSPPVFQHDDACTYNQLIRGQRLPEYTEQVSSISSNGDVSTLTVLHGRQGDRVVGYLRFTAQGHLIDWHRGGVSRLHAPAKEYIKFPLAFGKQWPVEVTLPHTINGRVVGKRTERLVAVFVGIEAIRVPAGAFQAIHVRLRGEVQLDVDPQHLGPQESATAKGLFTEELWFSTELGCNLRHTRHLVTYGVERENSVVELVRFRRRGLDVSHVTD